jgi:hypothetical protein
MEKKVRWNSKRQVKGGFLKKKIKNKKCTILKSK